jgi:hypothetical protein
MECTGFASYPTNSSLVACGFAEGVAFVLAAEELAGLRVDFDEFAVAPDAGALFVELGLAFGDVAVGFQRVDGGDGEALLELQDVGKVLVMEAWGVGCGLHVEAVVDDADEVVGDRGDDGRAAGLPSTRRSLPGSQGIGIPMWVWGGVLILWQTGGSLTMVGVMELSGRLPGAMALAGPWIKPKPLGTPILLAKSSISSLSRKPRPATVTPLPKVKLSV